MIESASRDIRRAADLETARRQETARLPALIAGLDDLLRELEELNLRRVAEAPEACRRRAAELIEAAMPAREAPPLPETVRGLMDRVYEAQDAVLQSRRRDPGGLDEPDREEDAWATHGP